MDYRKHVTVMDIECYRNYFLVAFRDANNPERTRRYEICDSHASFTEEQITAIRRMMRAATLVTFNGNSYDVPMTLLALEGATASELKSASDSIIKQRIRPWEFRDIHGLKIPAYLDHIDIFNLFKNGLSLKNYAARIGAKKLQDLPYDAEDPYLMLKPHEMRLLADYCDNDTINTLSLFKWKDVHDAIDLRIDLSKRTHIDFRSKSDAQLGEALFKYEVERRTGRKVYKPDFDTMPRKFRYTPPDFLYFETPELRHAFEILTEQRYYVKDTGHVELPEAIAKNKVMVGGRPYTIGIGGLHSNESSQAVICGEDEFLIDADVGSYYPSIIINGGYYPAHLTEAFLEAYREFRDTRLAKKHIAAFKILCAVYKIALNGTFGKLSSKYSVVYAPRMLIHVTLTGQLALLMLIERLESAGIHVVSANTDGIVIHGKKHQQAQMERIVSLWECETGYTMEFNAYRAIYSQSVNSYLAYKGEGKWKRKGDYAERGLDLSGSAQVSVKAVIEYLEKGTPLRDTVTQHKNFVDFAVFQQVKGGAYFDGEYLGKVVRWYYAQGSKQRIVTKTGNTVPRTTGCRPCMELPDSFPADVDYDWYIREAIKMLRDLGVKDLPKDDRALRRNSGLPRWGRKAGQVTYHLINQTSQEALCGAALGDIHDEWVYDEGERRCGKCLRAS
jgi:bcepGomrgp26